MNLSECLAAIAHHDANLLIQERGKIFSLAAFHAALSLDDRFLPAQVIWNSSDDPLLVGAGIVGCITFANPEIEPLPILMLPTETSYPSPDLTAESPPPE